MESANKMKLTYTNVNGYLIPNLTYKSGEQMEQLGKYGFLRRDYLKNYRNSTYQMMLLQDTIGEHIFEVDEFYGENEGLTVAEVELNSEDELFKKPHFIEKEVTGDIRYYNSFLMKNPYTRW